MLRRLIPFLARKKPKGTPKPKMYKGGKDKKTEVPKPTSRA